MSTSLSNILCYRGVSVLKDTWMVRPISKSSTSRAHLLYKNSFFAIGSGSFNKKIGGKEFKLNIRNSIINSHFFTVPILLSFNGLFFKTDLYLLFKIIKLLKVFQLGKFVEDLPLKLFLQVQMSRIFSSFFELDRRIYLKVLHKKLNSFCVRNPLVFSTFNADISLVSFYTYTNQNNTKVIKGFSTFSKVFLFRKNIKLQKLLYFLKKQEFFKKLYVTRFYFYNFRKKYTFSSLFLNYNTVKFGSFFGIYRLCFIKYRLINKLSFKVYKKLVWKRKKRKRKWKNTYIFRFFRSRYRLYYKFYIPKYFELNYKSLCFFYLGFVDQSSANARFPFWLNLRRLLTFVAY